VEYDLMYEPLRAMKGQVVADFIMDHDVQIDHEVFLAEGTAWQLFFDGFVYGHGQWVGCFIVSPNDTEYELYIRLGFDCTNNQAEYKALLSGLGVLADMEAWNVMIFGDSKLVVQQVTGGNQCLDGTLNMYREKCLEILEELDSYRIVHVSRDNNV
jgi:ribonuclease HI